jgi:quinolinate synthase
MVYRMSKDMPNKKFYAVGDAICQNMKRITIEKVVRSLETLTPVIDIPPDILKKARIPLDRMVEIGRG